ncbi:MAG: HAD family phosphatase [Cardiobacteriaceae bacterium]|nr:HAD family phosphatase [Cardiobacteriaceae bacterium]
MNTPIKAVAFDKDGVVFDSERLIYRAFRELIERDQLPLRVELFEELVGKPPEIYLRLLGEALGQTIPLDDFIARWFAMRDQIFAQEGAPFMPGADVLIHKLHQEGVPLALVTGDFRRNVERDFARSTHPELFEAFDVVITHDDVTQPKPDPQPYLQAAAALGIAPENLLVIEDSPPGIQAAVNAGCRTLILPGYGIITPELAARAHATIQHHDDVLEILHAYRA